MSPLGNITPGLPTGIMMPRALVESLVRATESTRSHAAATMAKLDRVEGLRWTSTGGLDAAVGVDELRAALQQLPGLDAARRARIDAVLQLSSEGRQLTVGQAASHLGLAGRDPSLVRRALQQQGLDVVLGAGAGSARVQRVPQVFLTSGSAAGVARTAAGTGGPAAGARAASAARAGGNALLAGGAVVLERLRGLPPRLQLVAGGGAALAGIAVAGAAVRGGEAGPGGAPTATIDTSTPRGKLLKAAADEIRSGNAAAAATTDSDALAEAERTRVAIVDAALGLFGTNDLAPDGSIDPTVRAMKAAALEGEPDDPGAAWELAFVAHVAREAGAPVGRDGKGAATAIDLRVWAEETGHFRPAQDAAARIPGNLVLLERIDAKGLTYHDVGVITSSADGALFVTAGNRMAGHSVTVGGKKVYVGTVGTVDDGPIPLDSSLKTNGIRIEGYIDPVSAPLPVAPKPAKPNRAAEEARNRAAIVKRAESQLNVTEQGGANRGPEVDQYWKSGGGWDAPNSDRLWCAAFTSWLYNEQRLPYFDRNGSLSTPQIRQWAIDNGIWHKRSSDYEPKPGDLIGFKGGSRGNKDINHIGIVKSYDPVTRMVTTIEGNTSGAPGVESNGGGVFEKRHRRDDPYIRGFVNVFEYYEKHPDGPK